MELPGGSARPGGREPAAPTPAPPGRGGRRRVRPPGSCATPRSGLVLPPDQVVRVSLVAMLSMSREGSSYTTEAPLSAPAPAGAAPVPSRGDVGETGRHPLLWARKTSSASRPWPSSLLVGAMPKLCSSEMQRSVEKDGDKERWLQPDATALFAPLWPSPPSETKLLKAVPLLLGVPSCQ